MCMRACVRVRAFACACSVMLCYRNCAHQHALDKSSVCDRRSARARGRGEGQGIKKEGDTERNTDGMHSVL